ncbi:MAG: hypothetical protein WCE79_03205 [Xanthobacteraceae bacterium]
MSVYALLYIALALTYFEAAIASAKRAERHDALREAIIACSYICFAVIAL